MSSATESWAESPSGAVSPSAVLAGSGHEASPPDVLARAADFSALVPKPAEGPPSSLDRLLDVTVTVTAELGRVTLPISAILNLKINSIVELDRTVSAPVDLMVQGVLLARAEVVVVGDCFAVRIKEIMEPKNTRPAPAR